MSPSHSSIWVVSETGVKAEFYYSVGFIGLWYKIPVMRRELPAALLEYLSTRSWFRHRHARYADDQPRHQCPELSIPCRCSQLIPDSVLLNEHVLPDLAPNLELDHPVIGLASTSANTNTPVSASRGTEFTHKSHKCLTSLIATCPRRHPPADDREGFLYDEWRVSSLPLCLGFCRSRRQWRISVLHFS